jgi:hypothetical protein
MAKSVSEINPKPPVKASWKFLCVRVETALEFVIAPAGGGH